VKLFLFMFSLAATCLTASAEINLTPRYSVRELEGCKFPQLEFRDGNQTITYEAPTGWQAVSRDWQTLALTPPGKEMVSAKIKFIPTPGQLVLDERQLQYFKETAHLLLPPESRMMADPTITPNPLSLGDHSTCEIDIYFVLHAQRMRMSVLFVDLGDSQLRFSLISRPADFDELHKEFRASWYSWQWAEAIQPTSAAR
jgi:hypothetical protein